MNGEDMITQARLHELLHYDPETGLFTWINKSSPYANAVKIGGAAGSPMSTGYIVIRVDREQHLAHRLAYLYMEGEFPPRHMDVDHKDTIPSNNRWDNLRLATRSKNKFNSNGNSNNKSGVKGVSYNKRHNYWVAQTTLNGKHITIGIFYDKDKAIHARQEWAKEHHGEFYNEGNK